jgi:SAM-dependent methyltransferase
VSVHDVAQRGFDAQAETYERIRPGYPADAIAWIVDQLDLRAGRTVVDLAAGTGKLTRLLVPTGADIVAVEPVSGMLDVLVRELPTVPALSATAERLPLRDGSVDAITIAQAFHWFSADVALPELHRVLRAGGRFAALWNRWDLDEDWTAQLREIMARAEASAPWLTMHNPSFDWFPELMATDSHFGPLHAARFANSQAITPDGLVDRMLSTSHVASKPPAERDAVLDEVRDLIAAHPDLRDREEIVFPYRVDCFWCERR